MGAFDGRIAGMISRHAVLFERVFMLFIHHNQAEVAAIDHVRQSLERVHAILEICGQGLRARQQALFSVGVQGAQRRGAREDQAAHRLRRA